MRETYSLTDSMRTTQGASHAGVQRWGKSRSTSAQEKSPCRVAAKWHVLRVSVKPCRVEPGKKAPRATSSAASLSGAPFVRAEPIVRDPRCVAAGVGSATVVTLSGAPSALAEAVVMVPSFVAAGGEGAIAATLSGAPSGISSGATYSAWSV